MTAYVNIKTGKIIGAKDRRTYLHEEGHLIYADSELGIRSQYYKQTLDDLMKVTLILILALVTKNNYVDLLVVLAGLFFIFSKGVDFYEEVWAWKYADKKLKEEQNGRNELTDTLDN